MAPKPSRVPACMMLVELGKSRQKKEAQKTVARHRQVPEYVMSQSATASHIWKSPVSVMQAIVLNPHLRCQENISIETRIRIIASVFSQFSLVSSQLFPDFDRFLYNFCRLLMLSTIILITWEATSRFGSRHHQAAPFAVTRAAKPSYSVPYRLYSTPPYCHCMLPATGSPFCSSIANGG